jgi:hypothetical protein
MMKKRMTIAIFSVLLVTILAQGTAITAHSPLPNSISYNYVDQELSVTFNHAVSDVNSHYIYQVVVEVNSVEVLTRDYTSQNTTSEFSAVYSIVAVEGDYIEVTAKCVVSGQYTQVLDLSPLDPGNGTPMFSIPLIGIVVVGVLVVAVIVVVVLRR